MPSTPPGSTSLRRFTRSSTSSQISSANHDGGYPVMLVIDVEEPDPLAKARGLEKLSFTQAR
jgi:hypothetical protein